MKNAVWDSSKAIGDYSVNSVCCNVEDNCYVAKEGKPFILKGYAYSGKGNQIVRVDVSLDGGKTHNEAELVAPGMRYDNS